MLNAEDRFNPISAIKRILLIIAVPWAAYAAADHAASLVLDLTGYKDLYPGLVGLLLCVVCYVAFSVLFLRGGEFLLHVRNRDHFLPSLGLLLLMFPVIYFASIWRLCC